jgi:hypothetical protein
MKEELEIIPPNNGTLTRLDSISPLLTAEETMAQRGFNPMNRLIDVAMGEALTKDHPILEYLRAWCNDSTDLISSDPPQFLNPDRYSELLERATTSLTDNWTSHDLIYKAAKDLVEYQHGKRKTEEQTTPAGEGTNEEVTPLTRPEIRSFIDIFREEYGGV